MERSRTREELLGVPVDLDAIDEVVDRLEALACGPKAASGGCRSFAAVNQYSLVLARRDPEMLAALRNADVVVADGAGAVLASKLLGGSLERRTPAPDVTRRLFARLAARRDRSCFFLGSTEEVLGRIRRRIGDDFPGLRIAGTLAPSFSPEIGREESARIVEAVNAAAPDVLLVGLGAPKQEKWVERYRRALHVPLVLSIGAAFDFFAGTLQRAPAVLGDHGLEWAYRLAVEPRRLWRRYLVLGPVFLADVARARITGERARPSSEER